MKVICVGMGKTGTKSITKALRYLGFTVFDFEEQNLDFFDHWVDVFQNGVKPDVKRVYQHADAVVDMPGSFIYEEILEVYPDCKVILSEREEDSWLNSLVNQYQQFQPRLHKLTMLSATARKVVNALEFYSNATVGSYNPKSTYVFRKRFRIHNHRVKSIIPKSKLLVYNVKQGWKPLCDFMGCEVPTVPFPHENVRGEIANTPLGMTRMGRQIKWEIQKSVLTSFCVLVMVVAIAIASCVKHY